ncbi:LINE-1 type transposase domain-containing 1 [Labeo rohita]|uniref:LINE-1 type transposase domain-containing 1 n=2 Tax=Labeo rohita TaxID=84645 RepID=A0A498LXL4_LABRO|nr:LINE-1 type transposase domain-containing 1 [Labeo rohita]
MSLDHYSSKGSDRKPKAKKIAPKSSTISGVEKDVDMDEASVISREEESSNSNFAQALDKLTENITKVIDEKVNTVLVAINDQTVQFQALVERVGQAEERIASVENSTESLQATVADLQKKLSEMSARIDDLENRGRRCNLRLVGLPEGTEGSDLVHFFEKWLLCET